MKPDDANAIDPRIEEANARKAVAEAASAEYAADKARLEVELAGSPLALEAAAAEKRKAVAEANQAVVKSKLSPVTALTEELSKIEGGKLTTEGDVPIYSNLLAQRALKAAAKQATGILPFGADSRVLVTTDIDLVSSDASYLQVMSQMDALNSACGVYIDDIEAGAEELTVDSLTAGTAAAAILPAIVSLLTSNRSLRTFEGAIDDHNAAVAVMENLLVEPPDKNAVYVLDEFRPVPDTEVNTAFNELKSNRARLAELRVTKLAERVNAEQARLAAEEEVKATNEAIRKAIAAEQPTDRLEETLREHKDNHAGAVTAERSLVVLIGHLDTLISSIDEYLTFVVSAPEGRKRSPLAEASIRAQLHDDGENAFSHVLLVRGAGGSSSMLVDDKPLLFRDRYSVVASASVSIVAIESATGHGVRSWLGTGSAHVRGKIGSSLSAEVV